MRAAAIGGATVSFALLLLKLSPATLDTPGLPLHITYNERGHSGTTYDPIDYVWDVHILDETHIRVTRAVSGTSIADEPQSVTYVRNGPEALKSTRTVSDTVDWQERVRHEVALPRALDEVMWVQFGTHSMVPPTDTITRMVPPIADLAFLEELEATDAITNIGTASILGRSATGFQVPPPAFGDDAAAGYLYTIWVDPESGLVLKQDFSLATNSGREIVADSLEEVPALTLLDILEPVITDRLRADGAATSFDPEQIAPLYLADGSYVNPGDFEYVITRKPSDWTGAYRITAPVLITSNITAAAENAVDQRSGMASSEGRDGWLVAQVVTGDAGEEVLIIQAPVQHRLPLDFGLAWPEDTAFGADAPDISAISNAVANTTDFPTYYEVATVHEIGDAGETGPVGDLIPWRFVAFVQRADPVRIMFLGRNLSQSQMQVVVTSFMPGQ